MPKIDIPYKRPPLYEMQQKFVDDESRFTYVEAGTKAGKTIAMIIWLHEQVIMSKKVNKNFWWVAPYYNTAKIAFNRWWNFIPDEIKSYFKLNQTEMSILYPNNNKVFFKSAEKPDALYGEDVWACVIDEASRMREDSWIAVRSTLTATEGRAKIIGNVKGRKNWFFKYAMQAKTEGKGYYRLTTYDNPFISREDIEDARKNLPENVFKELYLAEPSDDGSNPFGGKFITACVKPLSSLPPVCYGIDLAKSVDFTVVVGLDTNGDVCYLDRWQSDWATTKQKVLALDYVPMCIDSTGVGDPIVEELQKAKADDSIEGFKFTSASKQQLMEGLAMAIQRQEIGILDGAMQDELDAFEFVYSRTGVKYSAPDGLHDDIVMALALAWRKYKALDNMPMYLPMAWGKGK